uniref:SWIM-type domain-containing protein n=1 Tax=Setaria viridis TaxID=4556 RepID=A0A4U6SWA7_SETVI|nr:hypothetical protein SEVIR_9G170875v2 [Setaria viridis]
MSFRSSGSSLLALFHLNCVCTHGDTIFNNTSCLHGCCALILQSETYYHSFGKDMTITTLQLLTASHLRP